MTAIIDKFKNWKYFDEVAFVVAILLIMYAWKFAIEGLISEISE